MAGTWWLWTVALARDVYHVASCALDAVCTWFVCSKPPLDAPFHWNRGATGIPVVLVHGSSGNQTEWLSAYGHIARHLADHPVYAFSLDLPFDVETGEQDCDHHNVVRLKWLAHQRNACVSKYVQDLKQRLVFVQNQHQTQRVILVGHSMGGLVALQYAATHPRETQVEAVVCIASPLGGAPLLQYAWMRWVLCTRRHADMVPKSPFLTRLHLDAGHWSNKMLTAGSEQDLHVPDAYSRWPGAEHISVPGYMHLSMLQSEDLWKQIASWLHRPAEQ